MGSLLSKAGSTVFHARETTHNVRISAATKIEGFARDDETERWLPDNCFQT